MPVAYTSARFHLAAMKSVSLVAVLFLAACDSTGALLPAVGPEDAAAYAEDAGTLAFRHQLAAERDSATVELPDTFVRSVYEALIRVRASEHGGLVADIHTLPTYVPREVVVSVDTSAAWVAAWRRSAATTGDDTVDRLIRAYSLSFVWYEAYRSTPYASALIRSAAPLNTVALARQFSPAPGVRFAEPNGVIGDGDDIEAVRDRRGWTLTFSRGSGDCPAGCTERVYWTFRVAGDDVAYLGTRGA